MKRYSFVLFLVILLFPSPSHSREYVNISFAHQADAPYLNGMPEVNIDAEEFNTLVLKIRSNRPGSARLYWVTSFDNRLNDPKSVLFSVQRSRDFKEYTFDLRSQNPYWSGFVGQLLVYPESGIDGFEISTAIAGHRNIISYFRSGWREFWGPGGRILLGSSVNNMRAITLWGMPFNYYLYALIILTFFISFGYYYYKVGDVSVSWLNSGRITILICIICWGLWQASFLVTETGWLRTDMSKYGLFTSLEYKQRAALGDNFYDFLQFCKKELPERAGAKMITSDTMNFFHTKAIYYLYPMIVDSKEPKYLLVYMYNKGINEVISENKGFRSYKRFDGGAYILWKK